jgi:hypothetical protein
MDNSSDSNASEIALHAGLRLSRAKVPSELALTPSIDALKASDSKTAGRSAHKCLGTRRGRPRPSVEIPRTAATRYVTDVDCPVVGVV